jgi:hypothetical protein
MPQETLKPVSIIAAMLSGFPASAGTDVDMQIRAYLVAVDGIEPDAVKNAAKAFIQGKVKREDNRFAPSCAEFADRCRDEANMIAAQRRPKIEPPAPKPAAPRVNPEKMKLLLAMNNGSESARKKLREMGYRV